MSPEHAQTSSSKTLKMECVQLQGEVTLSLSPATNPLLLAMSLISSALHCIHTCMGGVPYARVLIGPTLSYGLTAQQAQPEIRPAPLRVPAS